jgi:hypothetical protein
MKALQRSFIIRLLLISIAVYGISYVVFSKLIIASLPLVSMIAVLFAINTLSYIFVTNTKEKKPNSFVFIYMAVSFGRMFVCAAFVCCYALLHRQDARTFGFTFFALYFLYNMVEVQAVYKFFKN